MELTPEMLKQIAAASSAEELRRQAEERGLELTAEEAAEYFAKTHPPLGALTDQELDNVAGGGCGGGASHSGGSVGAPASVPVMITGIKLNRPCPNCGCDCWDEGVSDVYRQFHFTCAVCKGGKVSMEQSNLPRAREYVTIDKSTVKIRRESEGIEMAQA